MCFIPCPTGASEGPQPGPDRVLEALGLPSQALVNVVMHLDLVPKAFVCDFTAAVGVGLGFGCYCVGVGGVRFGGLDALHTSDHTEPTLLSHARTPRPAP